MNRLKIHVTNISTTSRTHHISIFAICLVIALGISVLPVVVHAEDDTGEPISLQVMAPHVGSEMCYSSAPNSIFGVQVYRPSGYDSPFHDELSDIGASWLRLPVRWKSAEPENVAPSEFDWAEIDTMLAAASDSCINIVATILGNPYWASQSSEGTIYLHALDDLAQFAGALAERYDGDGNADAPGSPIVNHWELYNEPDIVKPFVLWGQTPEIYADMLHQTYDAIKAANNNAVVLIGGLGYDDFEDGGGTFSESFLSKVLDAGGGEYFDLMNIHYFPAYSSNWVSQGPGLLEKIEAIREVMDKYDIDKDIVVTETGHWVDGDSNEETQMRYLVQMFTQAVAADVKIMTWFSFYDLVGYESQMGLMTDPVDPTVRLSYHAFKTWVDEFGDMKFVRRLPQSEILSPIMEVYEFLDPNYNKTIYVAWINPISTEVSIPLVLPHQDVTLRNPFGHSSQLNDLVDTIADGKVTIPIGARPVFIEYENK